MKKIRLGDIATLITKGTTPTTIGFSFVDTGVNFVKIESIGENGEFLPDKFAHITDECDKKLKRSQLEENDILFSIAGAIGRTAIVPRSILPANTNQALAIIRIPQNAINLRFVLYALQSQAVEEQSEKQKQGVAQLNLSLKNIADIMIPLVSSEKQDEIVRNLAAVDAAIAIRKEQICLIDQLVKSRFIELFGEPLSNTKGWQTMPLVEAAPIKSQRGDLADEIWLLNLDAVEAQTGTVLFKHRVQSDEINASTVYFTRENVLYSKLRPYLNKVVMPDEDGVATSEMIPMYPLDGRLNRAYLCYWLRSDAFVKHISEKVAGAKMPRVSMDYFRSLSIELPPIELQEQFAAFVEQTDKSKLAVQQGLQELEILKKSLMQQYFG